MADDIDSNTGLITFGHGEHEKIHGGVGNGDIETHKATCSLEAYVDMGPRDDDGLIRKRFRRVLGLDEQLAAEVLICEPETGMAS